MSDSDPLKENKDAKFIEIPMASLRMPIIGNIPIAGGIYFRFLPLKLIKLGIKKLNKNGFSATCYIHPQDLDQNRPHLQGTSWHNYVELKNASKKFESILHDFEFSSIRDVYGL